MQITYKIGNLEELLKTCIHIRKFH